MSLDVWLQGPTYTTTCTCTDCGNSHMRETADVHFERNITHSLNLMAKAADIYLLLWHPDDPTLNITTAAQMIQPLQAGLARLRASPEKYTRFNAANGWGMYENLVNFVRTYLAACEKYPDAFVKVSR